MLRKVATAAAGAITAGVPEAFGGMPVIPAIGGPPSVAEMPVIPAIEVPALPEVETPEAPEGNTTVIACFGSAGFVGTSCEESGGSMADRCTEIISQQEEHCLPASVAPSSWLEDYEDEDVHEAFVIRWLLDSGAGRNLISMKHIPKTVAKFVGEPSEQGIVFDTGGGKKSGAKAFTSIGSFSGRKSTFVLEDSPPALCMGLQVNEERKPWIWVPGEFPFFVKAERAHELVIICPEDAKVYATDVIENVPVFDEEIKATYAMAGRLAPKDTPTTSSTQNGADEESKEPDTSGADGSGAAAEALSLPDAGQPDNAPPHSAGVSQLQVVQADDELAAAGEVPPPPVAEFDDVQGRIDKAKESKLRTEALSIGHLMTHFPKNPYCMYCQRAKLTAHYHRSQADRPKEDWEEPEHYGHRLRVDRIECDRDALAKGSRGETGALIMFDEFSDAVLVKPETVADTASHQTHLQSFAGPKCEKGGSLVIAKSDAAKAITTAVKNLGWEPDPSIPNDDKHNAKLERLIRTMKENMRASHLRAGFYHRFWPSSFEYASIARTITNMSTRDPNKTSYEMATGKTFEGPQIPLGALVYYRPKKGSLAMAQERALPGLFAGWRVHAGYNYRNSVFVLDYERIRKMDPSCGNPIEIHQKELIYDKDEPWTFPMANTLEANLNRVDGSPELPQIEARRVVQQKILPFAEDMRDVPTVEKKKRNEYITIDRMMEFEPTVGANGKCSACSNGHNNHSKQCRERFNRLIREKRERDERAAKAAPVDKSPANDPDLAPHPSEGVPAEASGTSEQGGQAETEERVALLPPLADASGEQVSVAGMSALTTELVNTLKAIAKEVQGLKKDNVSKPINMKQKTDLPRGPGVRSGIDVIESIRAEAMEYAQDLEDDAKAQLFARPVPALVSKVVRPKTKREDLPGYGMFIEFCCDENSTLGTVNASYGIKHHRLTKDNYDCLLKHNIDELLSYVKANPGIDMHGALPCTAWSIWQQMAIHRYGEEYVRKLEARRKESRKLLCHFLRVANAVIEGGGHVSFEWPRYCTGWALPELRAFIESNNLYEALPDGCALGVVDENGHPHLKPWRIVTTSERLARRLNAHKCAHPVGFKHAVTEGSRTGRTAFYPHALAEVFANSLYNNKINAHVPAMPVKPLRELQEHREREYDRRDFADMPEFGPPDLFFDGTNINDSVVPAEDNDLEFMTAESLVPGLVTKLLDRREYLSNPDAIAAVAKEIKGLQDAGTWDLSTVTEKEDLVCQSRSSGESIVLGDLMSIASIKFAEMAKQFWIMKGRCVFRGDCAKDEDGCLAVYQQLSANPTSISSANNNIAYGRLPGSKTTQADAIKAYVQSRLRSKHETWIALPREQWPAAWHKKGYKKPMVKLIMALYGHPEAGAHWERHLTEKVVAMGGVELKAEHPSSFWFKDRKLLLTVYVDDLLLSGPAEAHDAFWAEFRKHVNIEDPTEIDRFLGRQHDNISLELPVCDSESDDSEVDQTSAASRLMTLVDGMAFNMEDYVQQTVQKYVDCAGSAPLKKVPTPFVAEGSLNPSDDEVVGELQNSACGVIMKSLWVARLARPDVFKPINDLSSKVSKWTKNCDKQLHRLICYLHSTPGYRLTGYVNDPPHKLKLKLYVDADFAGDREDAKSTSGGFLVLAGPNTQFPLGWVAKKQTSVSRSTTEAEVVSLAHSLFQEALPVLSLWELMLDRKVELEVLEDNQATIACVQKGYSPKLRHILRTHKVNLASLHDVFEAEHITLEYINTQLQAADIFTKALEPQKWDNALRLLGIAKAGG